MRILYTLLITALLMLSGCMHPKLVPFTRGTGDAGAVMLQHAINGGGIVYATEGLPTMTAPWGYYEGERMVEFILSPSDCDALVAWLHQAFGNQRVGWTESTSKKPEEQWANYRFESTGGGLYFRYKTKGPHIGPQIAIFRPSNRSQASQARLKSLMNSRQERLPDYH